MLFLQNLRIKAGSATVLEGVALGFALTVAVGIATFTAQTKLPYKRMLVATGVLLGFVLLVMVGESVQELQLADAFGRRRASGVGSGSGSRSSRRSRASPRRRSLPCS